MSDLAYLLQKDINRLSHMERGELMILKHLNFLRCRSYGTHIKSDL